MARTHGTEESVTVVQPIAHRMHKALLCRGQLGLPRGGVKSLGLGMGNCDGSRGAAADHRTT
jgi:hypothetical protein